MKWCLEYSEEQEQYHIQTSEQRFKYPINGYKLISYHDTQEQAEEALMKSIDNKLGEIQ